MAIRDTLEKPEGDLTIPDMESLTELDLSVRARGFGSPAIASLKGLESARNLAVLNVSAGIATLEGQVDALWQKNRAEELVMDIQGIMGVVNKLAVVPTESVVDEAIAEDIIQAIDRNIFVNVDNVSVLVDGGSVTLSGEVRTITAKNEAFDVALNTSGVRAVINNIEVGS